MALVYEQHDAAFKSVSAFVVLKGGERVATVALKFGASGRVTAYVHWIGIEMVRGHADGGGYDKRSAAVAIAARKMVDGTKIHAGAGYSAFVAACREDGGNSWERELQDCGFTVLQAV